MDNPNELIVGVKPETQSVDAPLHIKPPSATDLQETAYSLRSKGYNSIPIYGKEPSTDKWEHLKTSPQSLDEIAGYKWKKASGLAVMLGYNDIHAIDVDKVKDESVLTDLVKKLGLPENYEWMEKTGGGYQLFFLCPVDRDKSNTKGDSVDERCDHFELRWKDCYSVVPPSAHYVREEKRFDGKNYSWMNGEPQGKPVELPLNIVMEAWKTFTKEKVEEAPPVKPVLPSEHTPEVEEAFQKFDMRAFLKAQGVAFEEKKGELRIEYAKGHSSLLYNEGRHESFYFADGKGGGILHALGLIIYGNYDFPKLRPVEKHYVFETLEHFSGVHIPLPAKRKKVEKKSVESGEIVWTSGSSIFNEPDEPEDWIIDGVLEMESFTSIYGPAGHGKSMATLELCLRVLCGRDTEWLGKKILKHGDVVYIRYEGSRKYFKKRFKRMATALGLSPEEMDGFHSIEKPPTLEVLREELKRVCELWSPVLIVVDSFYLGHEKEENSNTDMRALGKQLQDLMNDFGLCVLIIHHTLKWIEDKSLHADNFRGAAMIAMLESAMEFRQDTNSGHLHERFWKWVKLRDSEDEQKRCEGGYFDPESFFTIGTGETDERNHLKGTIMKKEKEIKLETYFTGNAGLPKSALAKMMVANEHIAPATAYRHIKDAVGKALKENPTTEMLFLKGSEPVEVEKV